MTVNSHGDYIKRKMATSSSPSLLYKDLTISLRSIRDLFTREVDRLIIDSKEELFKDDRNLRKFAEAIVSGINVYLERK